MSPNRNARIGRVRARAVELRDDAERRDDAEAVHQLSKLIIWSTDWGNYPNPGTLWLLHYAAVHQTRKRVPGAPIRILAVNAPRDSEMWIVLPGLTLVSDAE